MSQKVSQGFVVGLAAIPVNVALDVPPDVRQLTANKNNKNNKISINKNKSKREADNNNTCNKHNKIAQEREQ